MYLYIEGLELKQTMSTLVGFEIIEFETLQASEKSGNESTYVIFGENGVWGELCVMLIFHE